MRAVQGAKSKSLSDEDRSFLSNGTIDTNWPVKAASQKKKAADACADPA